MTEGIIIPDLATEAAVYGSNWWEILFGVADEFTGGLAGPVLLFAILVIGFVLGLVRLKPQGAALAGTGMSFLSAILFLYLKLIYGPEGWALLFLFFLLFAVAIIMAWIKNQAKEEAYSV